MKKVYIVVLSITVMVAVLLYGQISYSAKIRDIGEKAFKEAKMEEAKEKEMKISELTKVFNRIDAKGLEKVDSRTINSDFFEKLNNGEEQTIVFLGDSTTEEIAEHTNGKPGHVATIDSTFNKIYSPDLTVINAGKGGNSIQKMYDRLEESVISQSPDVVFINSGLNDSESESAYKSTLEKIIEDIQKETSAQIFLRTSNTTDSEPTNNKLKNKLVPVMKELADKYDLGYIDLNDYYNSVAGDDISKYNFNSFHPNENGQKLIYDSCLYILMKSSDQH